MRRRVLIFLLFFLPACRAEAQAPSRAASEVTSLCELIATASTMALGSAGEDGKVRATQNA